ncbi:DNA adenine methylase [Sphingomonas hengshuiensis]|uniref:site-specific DNA-methyltransferase (adenine-specific) n=1 Tax=Sphingomonas hengshuiensis TaxID=1609977 RepID=A0A7U4LG85_9SPHN|nr:DNA adenine methylase [Sphingomonas hengshuiensis]AJP72914.1 DNA methyltransferase [Sphingomonas hengshuiensis]
MAVSIAVRPAAGYLGGKRNLASRLVSLIETIPHRTYAEPFVGMGGVFLRRRSAAAAEAINDINGDVTTFFRVLQEHYAYFIDMLRWRVASRAEFQRLLAIPSERLTDLQRAARFLYLQRLAFGGKVSGRTFGVGARSPARFDVTKLEPVLAEIHERISGVTIEQLPYADFIRRYDGPGTLFYLDPPYAGCESDYGAGVFGPEDFARLADQLAGIRGRFILSINDTPEIRAAFARFSIDDVETTYSVATAATCGGKRVSELVIQG